MLSGRSSSRTRLMRVVFPAPDGPETMNKVPSGWKLLDILYLFADALDLGLQFYNHGPDRRRARLRAHGVDLAQHLLGEEVELLAGGFARADGLLDLVEMMREPRELLGDVALFDHDYDFLRDAVLRHVDSGRGGDLLYALLIARQQFGAHFIAMRGDLLAERANGRHARADVVAQRYAFARAHAVHLRERVAHDRGQGLALVVHDLGVDGFDLQQVGHAHQIAAGHRGSEAELLGDGAQLRDHGVGDLRVDAHVVIGLLRALDADRQVDLAAR